MRVGRTPSLDPLSFQARVFVYGQPAEVEPPLLSTAVYVSMLNGPVRCLPDVLDHLLCIDMHTRQDIVDGIFERGHI